MTIRRFSIPLLGMAALLAVSGPAAAWSPEGHQVIGRMAALYLTKSAKAEVEALLGGDAADAMERASTWADDIVAQRPDTLAWHFVDIPLDEGKYNPERDCPGGNCAVARMTADMKLLADKTQPKEQRAEALKYLINLMGEIHQPLRVVDDGHDHGRDIKVQFGDKRTNLFDVWETDVPKGLQGTTQQIVSRLRGKITPEHRKFWAYGTFIKWTEESAGQARVNIHDDLYGAARLSNEELLVSLEYPDVKRRLASELISRAAVRLAAALNFALK
ncbi:S1/P1 nuclease [Emcibacter sp. SYSU 3D8]|uniref:S1/P1 nuclease n=1 Tax=Emcibacter sp. SYSU 3D8 TaxID=3133969 RepID=UPI0031FE5168